MHVENAVCRQSIYYTGVEWPMATCRFEFVIIQPMCAVESAMRKIMVDHVKKHGFTTLDNRWVSPDRIKEIQITFEPESGLFGPGY
jgi:hypothetical protein